MLYLLYVLCGVRDGGTGGESEERDIRGMHDMSSL